MQEKIIETKQCKHCNISFEITDKDFEFYEKISPKFDGRKYLISSPNLCPDCRQQRRLSFINERKLYKRECSKTWKSIISIFSPDKKFKVYDSKEWWWNDYEWLEYWKKINFEKPFFIQYWELFKIVPKQNLVIENSENSEYNNYLSNSKNSYLSIWSWGVEDSAYISASWENKNSFDVWWSYGIENSYEIFNSASLFKSFYSQWCVDSSDLIFCRDCFNCQNCLFCYQLVWKKYCIMNKEYSKEDYNKKLIELDLFNFNKLTEYNKIFNNFLLSKPQKFINSTNSQNITWDYIYDSNNCKMSFNVVDLEDSTYAYECWRIKNLFDCSHIYDWEWLSLDSIMNIKIFNVIFSINVTNCTNLMYCSDLVSCNYCFLSTWLKNKEYCILNKQYSKKEYEDILPKIIQQMQKNYEWWEFFPSLLSPFWYNETVAQEYFPLKKEEALIKWFNWSDYEVLFQKVKKIIPADKLPDNINDIPDDILNWAIECEISNKPFRIIKQELDFYRKHNLPIPRKHPDQRHFDRMKLRNPRKLFDRDCDKCWEDMKTTYAPDREEKVYCEECYNKEVY